MAGDFADFQAQLRREFAPAPGDKAARFVECVDCGVGFWDWTIKWRRYCADCGADRQRDRYLRMRGDGHPSRTGSARAG